MIQRLIGATVVGLCLGGAAVSAAASPTTTPPVGPVPAPAPTQQPTGLGTDEALNLYATACFNGTMQACDNLYNQSPIGSAYDTYGDTCAGRRPAGTLPYCADVFTDTVPPQTLPTTASPPTTSVVTSTTTAAPSVPPTDPDLASQIPVVDGYSIAEMPAGDVLWKLFDSSLPGEFTRHHALIVAADGIPAAHLVVAATTGDRPAIDTFVEHTFADDVFLPADSVETDEGVFTTMNAAAPVWTEMEGNAVIVAEQEIDGNFQWAWSADDAVWIVRGKRDAENYVRALLQLHAPTLDPYDQQGMTGDLFDHTPSTPGYQYWDFPRDVTLDSLSATGFGDCAERFYLGYILPDGVTAEVVDNNLLWLGLEEAAGRCVEDGVLEDVAADIASGRQAEQIGGLTVYRDEQLTSALIGDVLITLYTTNPQTYIDMAPFIEQFFAGQPPSVDTTVVPTTTTTTTTMAATTTTTPTTTAPQSFRVDINSLTVGQCLLGAGLVDGDIGDGIIEVVDCSVPHHAEVFHVSRFDEPAGAPYPGDEAARNTTLARCHPAFDEYVGRIWAESRLGFTYVYPYDYEWEGNNRLVLCYLWDRLGRTLTGSMAGSGQ